MSDPSPDTKVRAAGMADAAVLASLARATFRETFVEDFAIPYPPADLAAFEARRFTADTFAQTIADPACAVFVAERDGEPAGFAVAGPAALPHPEVTPGDLELRSLYVARGAQGTGLGRDLLEAATGWISARRPSAVWLGVWSGNLKAQAIYARRGFEKVGEYDFEVGAWRDREFILRRPGYRTSKPPTPEPWTPEFWTSGP